MLAVLEIIAAVWKGYRGLPTAFHVVTWVALAFVCGWVSGCHHAHQSVSI